MSPRCVAKRLDRRWSVVVMAILCAGLLLSACDSPSTPKSDSELQAAIVDNMHTLVMTDMTMLKQAALDLQASAPSTVADGWDGSPAAVASMTSMREAWRRTRTYWERIEGTVAPLFMDLDDSMDARYEDILTALAGGGDPRPFDEGGATGMHAIERILYAPSPPPIADYEATLAGYWEASWPATDVAAMGMKIGLLQRLVDDAQSLLDRWKGRSIDLNIVFMGLTGLIASQEEKVSLAAQHQEESRYSSTTLADMRSNLTGTRDIYNLFIDWLDTKEAGMSLNDNAAQAFAELDQAYADTPGDALPAPPSTWVNGDAHTSAEVMTPFGMLYTAVAHAVDKNRPGSAVDAMNHVAWALGLSTEPPPSN
jgi:iron uptake system component EfeO